MLFEIGNLNKRGKYGMGQKNCIDNTKWTYNFSEKPKINKYFQTISINIIKNFISNKI